MHARIGGRTRIIAHLGVPTWSFKSPLIYNPWFRSRGIDCVVVPMGCEAADFAAFLPLARISHQGHGLHGAVGPAGKERREARCGASGKRLDAPCQPDSAALRVAPKRPPAASRTSTVGSATLFGPLLADRTPGRDAGRDLGEKCGLIFRLRNIAGALITMPHKVAAAGLLDEASPAVGICGSCNAVKRDGNGRLLGDMFDGEGFVRGVRSKGRAVEGASALAVGAGGVGSAIAASLARAGAAHLALFDIDGGACEKLAGRLRTHYPDLTVETGSNDPHGHDIVVNATPLGMKPGDALPMETDRIAPGSFAGDVVLTQEETPFLAAARARGCRTQAGIDMVFEQIPAYLDFFGFPAATPEELRRLAELDD